MTDCGCRCHVNPIAGCDIDGGCWQNHRDEQQAENCTGLVCSCPDGPCDRILRLTEHDLAALDPLHDRLGADHDGALVPAVGRQPVMRALNLRGPGAPGSVKIRLVPVWRTRRDKPKICSSQLGIEERPAVTLPVPWPAWVREPVIDEDTGQQLVVEDGDQQGETPIPALLEDWVRDCRRTLHLASWPRDKSVGEAVRWLGIHLQRWLDAHGDPVQLCEEIRRAANSARSVLQDYDPRPRLLYGVACPGRDDNHPCEALALWETAERDRVDCEVCGTRFMPWDERLTKSVMEALDIEDGSS